MIFASDLDRTLIYTEKLIEKINEDTVLVERYNGKNLSFMKKRVLETLKHVKKDVLFIPVTTRTIDQYNRIFMIKDYINPKYAIVSNGGNILIHGKIDSTWSNIVKTKLNEITNYRFIEKRFMNSFKDTSWINKMILRDKLFFSIHFDSKDKINIDELNEFKIWAEKNKWKVSLQGKKMYLVPYVVNKWDAVLYIKNKENIDKVVAAGDSLLDYPILINSDYSMCASHGELINIMQNNELDKAHIRLTSNKGIDASEEIIDDLIERLE